MKELGLEVMNCLKALFIAFVNEVKSSGKSKKL